MTEAKFEAIISDLAASETLGKGVLTSVLRLAAGDTQEQEILAQLDRFKEERETDIHELCGSEFKALLSGMQMVNGVYEGTTVAKSSLMTLQGGIADVSAALISAQSRMQPILSELDSITRIQASLQSLQTSVQTLKKAQSQITHSRLLSALRNIKKAKESAIGGSKSSQMLQSFAGILEETVSRQVDEMLSDWLLSARKSAETIGAQLFLESQERVRTVRAKTAKNQARQPRDSPGLSLKLSQIQPRRLNLYLTARESLTNAPATRQSVVLEEVHLTRLNFPVLYQMETVFQELDREHDFLDTLKRDRRAQIMQVGTLSLEMRNGLELLAGHLCIEKETSSHDDRWRSDEELQEIWLDVLSMVAHMTEERVRQARKCEEILLVKEATMLFLDTIQRAGFTQRCYELLEGMRSHHWTFFNLLVENFKEEAEEVINQDDYTPLKKGQDLEPVVAQFELDDVNVKEQYQFSTMVPLLCKLFSSYSQKNIQFLMDLQDPQEDVMFQNTDRMLHVLNEIITDQTRAATVLQTGMLAVDVTFLFQALNTYCMKLVEITGSVKDFSARTAFMQLKDTCEQAIFNKIQGRMNDLLSTIIDLNPASAKKHEWCAEALVYLEHTAVNLDRLCGQQVASTALITSLKYVSTALIRMLETCAKYNFFFLLELNLVGKEMEDFIVQSEICRETPGLIESLEELKQLTNLFITNDLMAVLDATVRQSKYPRLSLTMLASVLERYREAKGHNPKQAIAKSVLKKIKDLLK